MKHEKNAGVVLIDHLVLCIYVRCIIESEYVHTVVGTFVNASFSLRFSPQSRLKLHFYLLSQNSRGCPSIDDPSRIGT